CLPVTQEVAGSSPVRTAIIVNETIMFSFFFVFSFTVSSAWYHSQAFFISAISWIFQQNSIH
ncbi:hypothetical protein, partial [Bacillus rugosus]|uniref:hypothetical protein n=1 Tax=Bacillus rugosus TaxID=2715209 RepID=UPI001C3029AA